MASALQAVFIAFAGIAAVYYSGKGALVHRTISHVVHGKPGCLPVPEVGNVTIHYFAGRGRAETSRLLLEESGVHYTETKFDKDSWPANKIKGTNSGLYTYGQVPAIETTSGVKLSQSQVMLHYLARAYGFDCDCEEYHRCELIALGVEDVRSKLSKMLYDPDFSLEKIKEYLADIMPVWLGYLEKLAPSLTNQENAFFFSGRLTWVDFLVFDTFEANLDFAKTISHIVHGKPGCLPVPEVGNITMHYFAMRGRAEASRLLLEEAGVHYSETKFEEDSWPANKIKGTYSGLYTYGQVPAIETTSGVKLSQSQVILHYLARAYGFDCDCEEYHRCELIALGVEDVQSKLSNMLYDPDFSLEKTKEYLADIMPVWLGYLEKLAPSLKNQENAFFSSGRLTWVDFLVFDTFEANLDFAKYDFGTVMKIEVGLLTQFPKLANFYHQFIGKPNINRYLKSKRRYPFKLYYVPKEMRQKNSKI